jgi:hypothetical protein
VEEDDTSSESRSQTHQSQSLVAMNSILDNAARDIGNLEQSMSVFQQTSAGSLMVHRQAVNPLDVDRTVRQNIGESKDGITKAKAKLEQVKQQPVPSLTKSSNLGKITTLASLDSFLAPKNIRVNWGQNVSQIKTLVHNQHCDSPSFSASYSGTTSYSGYVSCTNTASVTVWRCDGCSHTNSYYISGCQLCGAVGKYCSWCQKHWEGNRDKFDKSQSFSGGTNYSGTTSYSGSHNVTCNQDHHTCQCQDWAEIILSFREVLQEKDFYKGAYDQLKSNLDLAKGACDDIRDIKTKLETTEQISNNALMVYNNERSGVDQILQQVGAMANMASQMIQNRESYSTAIRNILIEKEEEQKKDKEKLQYDLEQLEKKREKQEEEAKAERKEQERLTDEKIEKQEEEIKEGIRKEVIFEKEKSTIKDNLSKEKEDLREKIKEIEINAINQGHSSEKSLLEAASKLREADTRVRSILKMMGLNTEDQTKKKSLMEASRDKQLSLSDLLDKIEDYYA